MASLIPSLCIKNKGERPTNVMLRLTAARKRIILRLTGGCGFMSPEDALGLEDLFRASLAGFEGALLFGGTRMLSRSKSNACLTEDGNEGDPAPYSSLTIPPARAVVPGITEIACLIRRDNPGCVMLGVVPRTGEMQITADGLVVSDNESEPYQTIIHPEQDVCLLVQENADDPSPWDAEWQECVRITQDLRTLAAWTSLLVVYNGGGTTEREVVATAKRGWPVLLIRGSGRAADKLAEDEQFRQLYPNVRTADRTISSMRDELTALGAF